MFCIASFLISLSCFLSLNWTALVSVISVSVALDIIFIFVWINRIRFGVICADAGDYHLLVSLFLCLIKGRDIEGFSMFFSVAVI